MAKKKREQPQPLIKQLADDLARQSSQACRQYSLLQAKAQMAKLIYDNGASLESVAAKLGWPLQKLHDVFNPTLEIDLRVLSDVCTALGKRLSVSSTPIAKLVDE